MMKILGVGNAQVWADLSVPRVRALMVATYSLMPLELGQIIPLPICGSSLGGPHSKNILYYRISVDRHK